MMRKILALLPALLLATFAARAEDTVWRAGIVEAKSDSGIVMMPAQHDFAARRGLKIEFMQFKGDALMLKAMLAGELDSYEGTPGSPIIATAHGADVKLVGCYWPGLTYGIYGRGDVRQVADLRGHNLAISSPASLPDLVVRAALDQVGLPPSAVQFVALGSDADRFRALSMGTVDGAAFSTEFGPMLAGTGIVQLLNAAEKLPNFLRFCTYMSSQTVHDRAPLAAAFLATEMEGFAYALAHPDETLALTRATIHAKADDPRPAEMLRQVTTYKAVDPTMAISMDKLNWMQDLLVRTGNLPKASDLSRLVDTGPRQAALALLAAGH